jgi:hypothetical protein
MDIRYRWESLKERYNSENLSIDGEIILRIDGRKM